MSQPYILVLYYSQNGSTKDLAYLVAQGIEDSGTGIAARIRTVPKVSSETEKLRQVFLMRVTCTPPWTT